MNDVEPLAPDRPLHSCWPSLRRSAPFALLADLPTPVERLETLEQRIGARGPLFIKRDDISSPVYGGNKVRTLEALFGLAKALGARRIFSTGAFGSNHALATALHAPRVGLEPGVLLFPQPRAWPALENLRVTASYARFFLGLPHWLAFPWGMARLSRRERRGDPPGFVMVPGGATPEGALGYVSAALELGLQVQSGLLPAPRAIVLGVGSTCTTAGLLVGLALAARLGIGFVDSKGRPAPPLVVAVRVTPWPVTARFRVVGLAVRTAELLEKLTGDPSARCDARSLSSGLRIDGRFLGRGYGWPTPEGERTLSLFSELGLVALDTTYTAKAAAGFLAFARAEPGPSLFWSTKSTVPLPSLEPAALEAAPPGVRRFIEKAERELSESSRRDPRRTGPR